MAYPSAYDSLARVSAGDTAVDTDVNQTMDPIENLEHARGLSADARSPTGTDVAKLKDLLAAFKVASSAPSSPVLNDRWLDVSTPTAPLLNYWDGSAWQGAGDTRTLVGATQTAAASVTVPDAWLVPVTGTTPITALALPTEDRRPTTLVFLTTGGTLTGDATNTRLTTDFIAAAPYEGITLVYYDSASTWIEVGRNQYDQQQLTFGQRAAVYFAADTNEALLWAADRGDGVTTLMMQDESGVDHDLSQVPVTGRVASNQARAATTTLSTVTGLSVNVAAGQTYAFEAHLYVTADATGGQKYAIAGTATATAIIYDTIIGNLTTPGAATSRATALATAAALAGSGATAYQVVIRGTITVNAAGTLLVQAAQNSASGTTTILRGSTLVVTSVP